MSSELATLARPYASAVFKRAKQTNSADKWSQTLAFLSAVVSDKAFSGALHNPKISKKHLSSWLFDICGERIDAEGANFLKLVIENNRLGLVPEIADLFEKHKAEDAGFVDVDVFSAFELSKEDEASLVSRLEKTLAKKIRIKASVDKTLIGGVMVRIGDRVIDGSIKGQLQHMQKTLR